MVHAKQDVVKNDLIFATGDNETGEKAAERCVRIYQQKRRAFRTKNEKYEDARERIIQKLSEKAQEIARAASGIGG